MGIIKTKKNTDNGVEEKISNTDIHVSVPSQNIDIQNNPDTSIKDGSIPLLNPIYTIAVDPTQGRLLVQADSAGRKLYDLGPITGDEQFKRYIHYLEFVVKSDEIIKASSPNNYNEKFKILISSEIKNLKEKYIQTDGYCNITDFATVAEAGDLDYGICLEFDNNDSIGGTKLNIRSYGNILNGMNYIQNTFTTWNNCNTANNEYNIISVIINPAYNAGEISTVDDPIGMQILINHVLMNFTMDYTPNNDYIPLPYIENPHIYILFEAEQLADGSAIGKSFRTTIELNTNFDRFLYKDIAIQCYRNDMVDNVGEDVSIPPNNYWNYCQNYNWYPHRNINSIFAKSIDDVEALSTSDHIKHKTLNMTSHLTYLTPLLDENNSLQMELICDAMDQDLFEYVYVGTTRTGVPDWFINQSSAEDYSEYTKYSSYNTWYVPTFDELISICENQIGYTKTFKNSLLFNRGFMFCFYTRGGIEDSSSNNFEFSVLKINNNTISLVNQYNWGYYMPTHIGSEDKSIMTKFLNIDFINKTFCILGGVQYDITFTPRGMAETTLDFDELWNTIVDTDTEDTTIPYYTFIIHNSTWPKNSYLNLGSDPFDILNFDGIENMETEYGFTVKKRHASNNNWKSLIPYLTKKEIRFKYGTQDQPVILPYNLSTSENDSIFLTMTFPTSLTYNVRYWVVVGNGIGYSGTDQGQGITNLMNGIIISVDCSKTSGNFYYMAFKDGEQVGNMGGLTLDDGGVSVSYRSCLFRDTVSGETKIMLHGLEVGSDSTLFNELNTIAVHAEYVGSDTLSVGDDMGYVIINTNPDDYTTNYEELANQLLANDSGGGDQVIDEISVDDQEVIGYKFNYDDEYTDNGMIPKYVMKGTDYENDRYNHTFEGEVE